ncbi:MAG: helix-turn-helix domain-containing protein [Thermoplasmatota archaeon]
MAKNLEKEIQELQQRIKELEEMLSRAIQPIQSFSKTTQQYLRLVNLLLEHGGLTPEVIFPQIKDAISQQIIRSLLETPNQNVSEITQRVKNKRGTASRRIIRNKLKYLMEQKIVESNQQGTRIVYRLTDEVIKKWSQLLGLSI